MFDGISAQFIGQSLHFGVNLFAALACLAAGWLYLDAWAERRHTSELTKAGGFLLLSVAYLINGAVWGDPGLFGLLSSILKLAGYGAVIGSNIASPLQPRPKTTGYTPTPGGWLSAVPVAAGFGALLPVAALLVSWQYWRLATRGLERHLKPLAMAFTIFTFSELLSSTSIWQTSANPLLQPLVSPLGFVWALQHMMLVAGAFVLARWVWRYLTKRLLSQLFLAITSLTFIIVLLATTSVSALLLHNLQHDSLSSLTTTSKVLSYALDSKTAGTRASADILAKDPASVQATNARDHTALADLAGQLLVQKQLSEVIITDDAGLVLARGSDPERAGDSLSNQPLVQRALTGITTTSFTAHAGAASSTLVITATSPITYLGQTIGTATTSLALDNSFVDGLKHTTGLDSAIYSGATRAATTLTGPDGTSRSVGTKETNPRVIAQTLNQGQIWQGLTTISNQDYLAVYLPLKDINGKVVGMLFVGQPQDAIFSSARQAVKVTFAGAAIALLIIMLPVFAIARQISRQLH